jgi:hypothetical protein
MNKKKTQIKKSNPKLKDSQSINSKVTLFMDINLRKYIESTNIKYPARGLVVARHTFKTPYPPAANSLLLALAYMDLLIRGVYPAVTGFTKFTLLIDFIDEGTELSKALSNAVKLTYEPADGEETALVVPKEVTFNKIIEIIELFQQNYETAVITGVTIRAFSSNFKPPRARRYQSLDQFDQELYDIIQRSMSIKNMICSPSRDKQKKAPYIRKKKAPRNNDEGKVFMVGDIETLPYPMGKEGRDCHLAYAAGYMVVYPDKKPHKNYINRYFLEDYKHVLDDPVERSGKLLSEMIDNILSDAKHLRGAVTLYFHNMSQFDGILILRHLTLTHKDVHVEQLVRNSRIYEISIYKKSGKKKRKRRLVRILDSFLLLPASLRELAVSFCPNEKGKGEIDHDSVTLDTLAQNRVEYLEYLAQDILLLGLIMQKAQSINIQEYKLDVATMITIASYAMNIFRIHYYDDVNHRIFIPNENADNFIRSGFYGGHADMYIPYGEDLLMYDINSLYPSVMESSDMPGGMPIWHSDLSEKACGMRLDDMFGFIKALVVCPDGMERPFLPFRGDDKILLFPNGTFEGVYFSEELKYAVTLGYRVYTLSGYLFTRMESPFKGFVNELYQKRLEAKKKGEKAKAFILKTTMNSLYGRFGISPDSTITKIVSEKEAFKYVRQPGFINSEHLGDDKYTVTYKSNPSQDSEAKPPANTAVQISAAITAYARIKMYPFISREDCYYTDTDSIIIKTPLPDKYVSETELGKFKLEKKIPIAIFLAPKTYFIYPSGTEPEIIKHKGAGKALANQEWYESMLENLDNKIMENYEKKFHRNMKELFVQVRTLHITMGLNSRKREYLRDGKGRLVGTKPIHIGTDTLKGLGPTSHRAITALLIERDSLKNQLLKIDSTDAANSSNKDDEKSSDTNNHSGENKPE